MALSSLQLEAFTALARLGGFSRAAKLLHVTQSALSQRIRGLETEIGRTLFIRDRAGARLTEAGTELLRYTEMKERLEAETLAQLHASPGRGLVGSLRIGAYSSILRSVVIPALAPLLRANPELRLDFSVRPMAELPYLLQRAEVDMLILDYRWEKANLATHALGDEEYVMIESSAHPGRADYFLDNDESDTVTELFFRFQGKRPKNFRRAYYDDCYGIIEGVRQGLGRSVMSRHLLKGAKGIRTVPGYKLQKFPVTLHYFQQPFYTKAHTAVVEELARLAPRLLG